MWTIFLSGLQAIASAVADNADKVVSETESEATINPSANPAFDGKLPSPQQLLEMLDSMTGMSEEEKATLREDLLRNIASGGQPPEAVAGNDLGMQTMILFSLLGLVALIFENLLDSLKSHGLQLETLQEKLSSVLSEDAKEKFSEIVQRYQELNEQEKKEFMQQAYQTLKQSVLEKVQGDFNQHSEYFDTPSYSIFLFAVLFVALILVFFVYRLFKCLSEREMKREEKKKNKQLKKKK